MKPSIGLTIATLVIGMSVVACGDDAPAVCGSVDDLRTSIDDVREIDLTASGAVDELQSGLGTVEGNLADVKSDAQEEFSPEIDAVDTSLDGLKTAVDAAKTDPTAETLAAAAAALADFGTNAEALVDDVQSTC